MDNPQALQTPQDSLQRVVKLARDLAQGALEGKWTSIILVTTMRGIEEWITEGNYEHDQSLETYLAAWDEKFPAAKLLMALGYFAILKDKGDGSVDYVLTQKAFDLLNQPAAPPSVFISYRRNESSAFGLLLVARLKLVGVENPFIDMNIDPGAEWHAHLKQTIQRSKFFICLLGPHTLESEYVRKEIEWALDTQGLTIIPVWHNGFKRGDDYPLGLETKNAIRVKEESAEEYNIAVIRLLNILGYAP
jgi:hypothetical protein